MPNPCGNNDCRGFRGCLATRGFFRWVKHYHVIWPGWNIRGVSYDLSASNNGRSDMVGMMRKNLRQLLFLVFFFRYVARVFKASVISRLNVRFPGLELHASPMILRQACRSEDHSLPVRNTKTGRAIRRGVCWCHKLPSLVDLLLFSRQLAAAVPYERRSHGLSDDFPIFYVNMELCIRKCRLVPDG